MTISKLHMELASAGKNVSYFFEPIKEAFVAAGLDDIEIIDNSSSIEVKSSVEGIDVLLSQIAINLGLEEAGCVVVPNEDSVSLEFSWNNMETAGPLDFEEDEEVEDIPEDVEDALEEDEDLEEEDKEQIKTKMKKGLEVLKTPEAQKLVQRLYQLSNGDNISAFPVFWNELDDFCLKYRKQSGYKPEEPDDLDTEKAMLIEFAFEEVAKTKKWVGGRKGFLSALMKGVASKGAEIDKAWDSLDGAGLAKLLEDVCYPVLDKIAQERENRGMEEEEEKIDDSSDIEEASFPVTAAKHFISKPSKKDRPYHTLVIRNEDGKWEPEFGDYEKSVVKDELQNYRDHFVKLKDMKILTTKDSSMKAIEEEIKKLNES